MASSTSIKVVGGLSAKDASFFARDMRTTPEFFQSMRKSAAQTEFACFVRHFTPQPIRLTVPLGEMERRPKLSEAQLRVILEVNRERCCSRVGETPAEQPRPGKADAEEGLGEPDLL